MSTVVPELGSIRLRRDSGLYGYERALHRAGLDPVAGADEAGRGACAGPLVAGAVRAAVAGATGLDLAAVLVVPEHPTDIRHNSKIDRALLAGWAEHALAGGRIRNP